MAVSQLVVVTCNLCGRSDDVIASVLLTHIDVVQWQQLAFMNGTRGGAYREGGKKRPRKTWTTLRLVY